MSAADKTKLDGIEASATADQTNAEIRAAVEAASDSNVFTDADHSKLNAIEASATADQTAAEIRTLVESASDSNVFTDADHTKLNAIEASATADQTASEIRTLVESASDSNVFTDADHSKLNAIEASADVTDATNVDAAGAVMNSDLDTKGEILVGDGSGDPTALSVGTNGYILTADSSEATGIKWAANAGGGGGGGALGNVVEDTSPQLGGDLDVNGNDIVSTSNGSINITPNGSGDVVIDGLKYPQADGSANQFLKTNGSAQLSWSTVTTDLVGDTSPQLGGDLDVNGNEIISSATNGAIELNPNGTGNINLKTAVGGTTNLTSGGDVIFAGGVVNKICQWDYNEYQLEFWDDVKASFGSDEDFEIWHDSTDNQIKGNNGKIVVSTTAGNSDIEITPHGTGDVVIDGLKYPQADGSAGQVLKTDGSAQLSWVNQSAGTITALNNQAANRLTTIGSTTTQLDGEASLTFEDTTSTGLISGKQITGRGFECPATVSDDWTIAAGNNAFFPGPMTVAASKTVTVPANRTLTIV